MKIAKLLFLFLLTSTSALAAGIDQTIIRLTVTNVPMDGNTLVVNGSTRTWKDTVVTPSSQIRTNGTIGGATTNLWQHIVSYTFGGSIRLSWLGTNQIEFISNPGVTLGASITGSWGLLQTNALAVQTTYPIIVPAAAAYPLNTDRTNKMSLLVSDLSRYPSNFFNISAEGLAFPRLNYSSLISGVNVGANFGTAVYVKIDTGPTAAFTIAGVVSANSRNGRMLIVENATPYNCSLDNESAAETTAANRIITGTGSTVSIGTSMFMLVYDTEAARWKLFSGSGGSSGGAGGFPTVNTIAELRARSVFLPENTVFVRGYSSFNDGGQGTFTLDTTSSATDDGGIVIAPTAGGGRWKRVLDGNQYEALWWGPTRTNATLQSAINYVSANGGGVVNAAGGDWTVKSDDSTRILMKSGVTLITSGDSQIVCAANPTNNWILVDFPLGASNITVGPARLVGWNLLPPNYDTNKTGVIFSLKDTSNVTIGGVRANNWYSRYIDADIDNRNLNLYDEEWQIGGKAFGARGDGVTDDRKSLQDYAHFCESTKQDFYLRPTTNGYLIAGTGETVAGGIYFTNGIPVKIRGEKTLIKVQYYNPTEGTLGHISAAFVITANNCVVEGFNIQTVGAFPTTETNSPVTGFFTPIAIHMGTNTVIKNNEFHVASGKAISFGGASYTKIINNDFYDCGVTAGIGHQPDWLFYEAASPTRAGPPRSPIGCVISGNTFHRGSPYKHVLFLSGCDAFTVENNQFPNQYTISGPIVVYSGDEGTTDQYGTNIFKVSGAIRNNSIDGTLFGEAAITVRLNTLTNLLPATFNPDNMYSAVTIEGNHIYGGGLNGRGIEILKAPGTKIINNDVRTGGTPIFRVGNVNDLLVDTGWYEATNASPGCTFPFANGFLAPASSARVTFLNATLVSPAGDECMFRNEEPLSCDSLTIRNCDLRFNGAAGTDDFPQLFQFSIGTNWMNFSDNRIYLGASMHARRLGVILNTNADLILDNNRTFMAAPYIRRGPSIYARTANISRNDIGNLEIQADVGLLSRNTFIAETNTVKALDIHASGRATVIGNTALNLHSSAVLAISLAATNSVLFGNTISGNTAGNLAEVILGKCYESDNPIINPGGGSLFPQTSGSGSIAHSVFERAVFMLSDLTVAGKIGVGTGGGVIAGVGNPQGVVAAPVGWIYLTTDGSGGVYNKTNGTGNTGWMPIGGGGGGLGDVVGPAVAVDKQVVLYNGTTGKLISGASSWVDDGVSFKPITTGKTIGSQADPISTGYFDYGIIIDGLRIHARTTGTPEAAETMDSGSLVLREDGSYDTTLYIKAVGDGINTGWAGVPTQIYVPIVCSDEVTPLTTGTAKRTIRMPGALILTSVRAELVTAQTSGSIFTINVKEAGTTIFSVKPTIDNTETTTATAATASVLSDTSLADNAVITVDIDQTGSGTAAGLKVLFIGHR